MYWARILLIGEAAVVVAVACAITISRVPASLLTSDAFWLAGAVAILAVIATRIAKDFLGPRWSPAGSRAFESVWLIGLLLTAWYVGGESPGTPIAWMRNLYWIGIAAILFDKAYGGRRASLAGSVAALGCGLYGAWSGSPLAFVGLGTFGALLLTSATVIGVSVAYLRTPTATREARTWRQMWWILALVLLIALIFTVGGIVYVSWR